MANDWSTQDGQEWWLRGVDRRTLLRQAAMGGLSLSSVAWLLAACGGASSPTSANASRASTSAAVGAAQGRSGGSLTIGLNLEPDNLDPAVTPFAVSHTVMMNIYDTLVWRDDGGKFYPGLAKSWTASPDGTQYAFKLRNDVKFHDGTPFNAQAVKFNFDRIANPNTHSGFAANLLGPYDHTDVVDPYTARVFFKAPFAPFLDGASQAFLGMVSPTAVQKDPKGFGSNPVGTGFMKFDNWVRQDHIALSRNPDYKWAPSMFQHQGPAYLDNITFRFYTDDSTRLSALQSGDVQDIETIVYSEYQHIKSDPTYSVVQAVPPGIPTVLSVNTRLAPTSDLAVRQALIYATNQAAICKVGFFGVAEPVHGPLWQGTPDYSAAAASMYSYDPKKAMQILDSAGWKAGSNGIRSNNGEDLSVSWAATPTYKPFAALLQAQWQQVGVKLNIEQMLVPAAFAAISKGSVNMAGIGWISSDPVILSNLFLSSNMNGGYNWSKYASTALDHLLNQGEEATSASTRASLYAQIQKTIMENALMVPLYATPHVIAILSKYKGLKLDFRTYQWLYDVYVA